MSSNSLDKFTDQPLEELTKSITSANINSAPVTPTTCCSDIYGNQNEEQNVQEYLED